MKINLANNLLRPFKAFKNAPIFIVQKTDGNFQLCINYQLLNNLTINN